MKRRRHTPEQIIRKLRDAERLIGEGNTIPEAAKELQVSEQPSASNAVSTLAICGVDHWQARANCPVRSGLSPRARIASASDSDEHCQHS